MVDEPPKPQTSQSSTFDWDEEIKKKLHPPSSISSDQAQVDTPPTNGQKEDKLLEETAADMQSNRGLREKFAEKAYEMAIGCLVSLGVMIISNGVMTALGKPMWSDTIILAVTAAVTVNVLAAFLGVIRGLFPSKESFDKSANSENDL